MSASDYLGRWIDLAAHLLAQPIWHDPMLEICNELSLRFDASAAGTVDFSSQRVRIGLYRSAVSDPEALAPNVGDHPLALYYRATGDTRARALPDAGSFLSNPWARSYLHRLRDERLIDFVFLPLKHRQGMEHRWLALSTADRLSAAARDEIDRLGPLLRAVDAQASVLASTLCVTPPRAHATLDLSTRELAVLGLVARGMTASAIGSQLRISQRTVSKHQQHIYQKLDVGDRLTAVMRAHALGILPRHDAEQCGHSTVVESRVDRHLAPAGDPASPVRTSA